MRAGLRNAKYVFDLRQCAWLDLDNVFIVSERSARIEPLF